jgi:transmembrane sensor
MMDMNNLNNNIDDVLLAKYLDGSTSDEENTAVENWIELSKENKDVFNQFKTIWFQSQGLGVNTKLSFDKEKAFKNVLTRIDEEETVNQKTIKPKNKIVKLTTNLARIAAVLIIGVSIYFIYQNYYSSEKDELLTDANTEQEFISSDSSFIILPENSLINLNVGSEIKYAKNFTENRKVLLTGEAFFEVKKLEGKSFIVQSGDLQVKVLGTSFYINPQTNDSIIEVGVVTGKVEVRQNTHQKSVLLEANKKVRYNLKTKSFYQTELLDLNAIFWKTSVLEFNEKPLDQVLNALAINFKAQIDFQKDEFTNCIFTGRFQDATLTEILDQLQFNFGIKVTRNEVGRVSIKGKRCD